MKPAPPEPPARTREAAFIAAGVSLIGGGFLIGNGWPLVLAGLVLLVMAVSQPS